MKKIILFALFSGVLFAQTKSDVSLTAGYNKFDDPLFLRNGHMAYGIRGGVYKDNGLGYQLGFEHISNANCKGLKLNRVYTNALILSKREAKLRPYGLVSVGYETSSIHEHKPNQFFVGAGAGLKYIMTPNVNAFIETRVLQKLKSHDIDVVTTLGLSYSIKNEKSYISTMPTFLKVAKPIKTIASNKIVQNQQLYIESDKQFSSTKSFYVKQPIQKYNHYYVQLAALSKSSAAPLLNKLYSKGITNVSVQQVYRGSKAFSIVVVGPYQSKSAAIKNLKKYKRFDGAFVTKI